MCISESGGWSYTAGLPSELTKLFHGRATHHPSPTYCQLGIGSEDKPPRWLVRFSNGKVSWSVPSAFVDSYNESAVRLSFCAFGEDDSYYMQFADGSAEWRGLSDRHDTKIRSGGVSFLSLGPQNQMFIRFSSGKVGWVDGPKETMDKVSSLLSKGYDVRQVVFGGTGGDEFVIRYS